MLENILEKIFELQTIFQKSLGYNIPKYALSIMSKENVELIKIQTLALIDEAMESLREVPWKPWKNTNRTIDLEAYRMELIDIFHFLVNLFIFAGMDTQMVLEYYLRKNKINLERQKSGY